MKKSMTFVPIAAVWVPMVLLGCFDTGSELGHSDVELLVQQEEHWTRQRQKDSRSRKWEAALEAGDALACLPESPMDVSGDQA